MARDSIDSNCELHRAIIILSDATVLVLVLSERTARLLRDYTSDKAKTWFDVFYSCSHV